MCSIAVEMFLVDCDRLISRDSLFHGQVTEEELHPIVISRRLQVLKACLKETVMTGSIWKWVAFLGNLGSIWISS